MEHENTGRYHIKYEHLNRMKVHRKTLYEKPQLKRLFLELTLRCNEYCFHCGSRCGDLKSEELSLEQYDGPPETHDRLRGLKGAYHMAMDGIQALIDNGNFNHVQITTIVNRENIGELPELMLTLPDYHHLFEYIRNKRRQCGKHNGKR